MNLELVLLSLWFVHQTMDIVGVKGYVDRPKLLSPDTFVWAVLTVLFVLNTLGLPYVRLALALLFGLGVYGMWLFHWKLFFFGASEKKINSYNKYFENTHRVFPLSQTRIIPDTYHIVHTFIGLSNFVVLAINVYRIGA